MDLEISKPILAMRTYVLVPPPPLIFSKINKLFTIRVLHFNTKALYILRVSNLNIEMNLMIGLACALGYTGRNCESAIDYCADVTCSDHGKCQNKNGGQNVTARKDGQDQGNEHSIKQISCSTLLILISCFKH